MINLNNLNIILTGATGVIGGSILQKLVEGNANIIATGTNQEKLDSINEKFKNVKTIKFDISNHSLIEKFIDDCNEIFQNNINILINNAGITADNLTIRMKDEEWNKVINLNLTSSISLTNMSLMPLPFNSSEKLL